MPSGCLASWFWVEERGTSYSLGSGPRDAKAQGAGARAIYGWWNFGCAYGVAQVWGRQGIPVHWHRLLTGPEAVLRTVMLCGIKTAHKWASTLTCYELSSSQSDPPHAHAVRFIQPGSVNSSAHVVAMPLHRDTFRCNRDLRPRTDDHASFLLAAHALAPVTVTAPGARSYNVFSISITSRTPSSMACTRALSRRCSGRRGCPP